MLTYDTTFRVQVNKTPFIQYNSFTSQAKVHQTPDSQFARYTTQPNKSVSSHVCIDEKLTIFSNVKNK